MYFKQLVCKANYVKQKIKKFQKIFAAVALETLNGF